MVVGGERERVLQMKEYQRRNKERDGLKGEGKEERKEGNGDGSTKGTVHGNGK